MPITGRPGSSRLGGTAAGIILRTGVGVGVPVGCGVNVGGGRGVGGAVEVGGATVAVAVAVAVGVAVGVASGVGVKVGNGVTVGVMVDVGVGVTKGTSQKIGKVLLEPGKATGPRDFRGAPASRTSTAASTTACSAVVPFLGLGRRLRRWVLVSECLCARE